MLTIIDDLLDIFQQNKVICCIIFVLIGLLFTFFGRNAYKFTLIFCGFILGFITIAGLCYSFGLMTAATDQTKYIIFGISLLVGIIAGYLLYKFEVATIMIVCGLLTVIIVMAIIATFFANVAINTYVELVILVAAGMLGAALGAYFKE